MNCNLSAVFSQVLIFLALLPVRLWCLQRDSAKLLPWICKIQLIASDNKRLCIFILFWYFLSENILLHCLLLARSTNPTPEGPVCRSWAVAKPGFPGLLLEIRPLYLPSCVTGLHLREGWSVKQSTLRGFNHTDATIPCCLVGLFPGKALLEPYLPVLHIFCKDAALLSLLYSPLLLLKRVWSSQCCLGSAAETGTEDSFPSGCKALSCSASGLGFGALCPWETDQGISQNGFH